MIGLTGYGQSQILNSYRDSIVQDTILLREGRIIKVLVQTKYTSYRSMKEIKADTNLSKDQIKKILQGQSVTVSNTSHKWFIKFLVPVVRETETKQLLYYYLDENNEIVSDKIFASVKGGG
ncbi:hypothetical protein AUJ35_03165 [Candidatus Falkowbacteria bacterium CG1_02_41_21]|uniref:Uncharacterized protein n=1 Tax=Candidatus Falkowbacteria bacterium CG1_02_41_21 TaxID=1805147 RepID=A0A1J4T8Q0_9BACT|nr:MAG: hypothetical protein AUJ35_03165 [Candidatus Falkowbacteria bacterium CG1_02_41_21]